MLEFIIDNKDGNMWEVSELVSDVSWKTSRIGKASSLDFTLIKDQNFKCNNGDVIRVKLGGHNVFYGYIFEISSGKDETVKIKAYDQMRYLMNNFAYTFSKVTASEMVSVIAKDFGLSTGMLTDTKHKLSLNDENKKMMDIICDALARTLIATGEIFVFYDDFGELTLRNVKDMIVDVVVGDGSLMYDFSAAQSIDQDTYNYIVILQKINNTKEKISYFEKDDANIAKWGRLQLFQVVDEKMNSAQINEQLRTLKVLKNRETKTLKIDALGDIRIRAGCYIPITIKELGINQYFLVEECSHKNIEGPDHTMSLDLKVIS